MSRTGGEAVVERLVAHGVRTTFGVPGESYLPVLDALLDTDIRVVTCRHEGGAAFMAEAWGKLTGDPGICLVTRGPGASNAAIGVHAARQASTPMVLLVGQVPTPHLGREAFQEVDYPQMFGGMAKWVTQLGSADDVPAAIDEAFARARGGRPGPVVVALPEDVLSSTTTVAATSVALPRPTAPDPTEIDAIVERLAAARRPVLLVGGPGWDDHARRELTRVAEAIDAPVVAAFRFHDVIDNHHPAYAGEAGIAMPPPVRATLAEADCVVGLGVRLGEMTTDAWSVWPTPQPGIELVLVHPDPSDISPAHRPTVAIAAAVGPTLDALASRSLPRTDGAWRAERRAAFLPTVQAPAQPGDLDMAAVTAHLRGRLPSDVIVTNGAGNFSVWPNKHLLYGARARLLAPQCGAMGYGLPAAVAAKVAHPERMVVCVAGDGDLQMTMAELATARQADATPIVLVVDNGRYGTIRMHQERRYPARVVGTDLVNPDFVAVARAHGMHGERVDHTAAFEAAFERAAASTTGALLHLVVEPDQLTPHLTVAQARAAASTG